MTEKRRWSPEALPVIGPVIAELRADPPADNAFAEAALERHKREGMDFAVRARFIAMGVIAVMLPLVNPRFEMIYYEAILLGFVAIGWMQRRVARVGRNRREMRLIVADILLMTAALLVPNPLDHDAMPLAMQYRSGGFAYFFVLIALATLAFHWRTLWGIGVITATVWIAALGLITAYAPESEALAAAHAAAFPGDGYLSLLMDPNDPLAFIRVQETIAFLLVAAILAANARRSNRLLMDQAAAERERANLARYFSPNVVDQLSHSDEPLREVRSQDIAVLFVDIVGFTAYAAARPSAEVIETLREFHKRMEAQVFAHEGTLDKYLGDGLMATFGTPFAGQRDASNALACARAMMAALAAWNAERAARGEPEIRAGFGLHYGPVVLGDIGANRLEFAVIGDTVNVASRLEALTRGLHVELAATTELKSRVERENGGGCALVEGLAPRPEQEIRGLTRKMDLWTLGGEAARSAGATLH